MKKYMDRRRIANSDTGKYRYEYYVACSVCNKEYWTKSYPSKPSRCRHCAGVQSYTPAKESRSNTRKRGEGYITKQGYLLVYTGKSYEPAHRLVLPPSNPNNVIHHIDGDKLNNLRENLVELTKQTHREAHGSLEKVSYQLIQAGLIEYDHETNTYNLGRALQKCIALNPVNSGNTQTDDAVGNPEPSQLITGRCNDYPKGEYIRSLMEAQDTLACSDEGEDIVSSHVKA